MTAKTYTAEQIEDAKRILSKYVKPGSTVYTLIRSTSKSGMVRKLAVFVAYISENGTPEINDVTAWAAKASGYRFDPDNFAVVVNGAQFDAGLEIVDAIGRRLFGQDHNLRHSKL